ATRRPAPGPSRTRNAIFVELQVDGIGTVVVPENSASPCALRVTAGVSLICWVARPGSQTTEPTTLLTAPGVPMVLPPSKTRPSTSKVTWLVAKFTFARPPSVIHGRPPGGIASTAFGWAAPALLKNGEEPAILRHRTVSAAAGEAIADMSRAPVTMATPTFA